MVAARERMLRVEELMPSGHAWKNPRPANWPTEVGVSSKVKRGNAGGQKGVIRTEKHGQFRERLAGHTE